MEKMRKMRQEGRHDPVDCGEGQQVGPRVEVVDLGVDRKDGRVALFKVTPHLVGLLALQGAL